MTLIRIYNDPWHGAVRSHRSPAGVTLHAPPAADVRDPRGSAVPTHSTPSRAKGANRWPEDPDG